jgi:hypothetical protein
VRDGVSDKKSKFARHRHRRVVNVGGGEESPARKDCACKREKERNLFIYSDFIENTWPSCCIR